MAGIRSVRRGRRALLVVIAILLIALLAWLFSDPLTRPSGGGGASQDGGSGSGVEETDTTTEADTTPEAEDSTQQPDPELLDSVSTALQLKDEALRGGASLEDLFGAVDAIGPLLSRPISDEQLELLTTAQAALRDDLRQTLRRIGGAVLEDGSDALHITEAADLAGALEEAAMGAPSGDLIDALCAELDYPMTGLLAGGESPSEPADPIARPTVRGESGWVLTASRAKGPIWAFSLSGGFQRFSRYECEWIGEGETAASALAQCRAALRDGDFGYAFAWYARAVQRGAESEALAELSKWFRAG